MLCAPRFPPLLPSLPKDSYVANPKACILFSIYSAIYASIYSAIFAAILAAMSSGDCRRLGWAFARRIDSEDQECKGETHVPLGNCKHCWIDEFFFDWKCSGRGHGAGGAGG